MIKLTQQTVHIPWMQTRSRLIQHIQRRASGITLQLGRQLDPLRLTAGQLGRRLPQTQIPQTDIPQHLQRTQHPRLLGKHLDRLLHGQPQHLGNAQALPLDRQRFRVITRPMTRRTRRIHTGHKQQLDTDKPFPLAMGATALGDVERELPGVELTLPGRRRCRKQFAHVIEQTGVSRQIGARRAADGFLVHLHQTSNLFQTAADPPATALRGIVFKARFFVAFQHTAQPCPHQFQQRLADQTGLARTGNTRHRRKATQREIHAQVLEVITRHAFKLQPPGRLTSRTAASAPLGEQILARLRRLHIRQPGGRAAVQHLPAVLTGRRAHVDQPVGAAHGFQVMFHHKQRIAGGFQTLKRSEQCFAIRRVQARRGFVQHIDHAEQLRTQLGGQAQALQFPG
ncbi:hypothetical protein ALP97_05238 [Pseudomonas salomonii]|uniref:Uncharacterized protein n=1 Tax=Pseudomonas salomonii TaxID=191391 RepID=A0A3M4QNA3_9PSED|nr:hypothetical protein ALP97_05238 [Pseudomonas salomonii]